MGSIIDTFHLMHRNWVCRMAKRKVLSPFSFYGGKDRMAPLICDLLDYKHTDLYIEPFGGACRVLLNKPRHAQEIYNDFGYGLTTFFETLGNRELSQAVFDTLIELKPNEELFYQMKSYKQEHEHELTDNLQQQFQKFVWKCWKKYQSQELKILHKAVSNKEYQRIVDTASQIISTNVIKDIQDMQIFHDFILLYHQYWDIVKEEYQEEYDNAKSIFEIEWKKQNDDSKIRNKQKFQHKFCHERALSKIAEYTSDTRVSNGEEQDKDPVQMAVATFITYYLSRDGMGLDYSSAKNRSTDKYYSYLQNLKDIAQRFEGVVVTQVDALNLIENYCQYENVMMYLDPSYLKPEDANKDLGSGIYSRSFGYEEHKRLADIIQNAKAKIILSNYEVEPYLSILSEDKGWKKYYYDTYTSVGSKRNNKRTEVLWYNY